MSNCVSLLGGDLYDRSPQRNVLSLNCKVCQRFDSMSDRVYERGRLGSARIESVMICFRDNETSSRAFWVRGSRSSNRESDVSWVEARTGCRPEDAERLNRLLEYQGEVVMNSMRLDYI
ncbi:hypothetical protein [Phaffia rhodozyma]|uniref:Uncharacterized protein n=1 Tax=Phaffia rhodozyma TaxID=264483 RepID=A0A0F7SHF6_PHARH|nr:hypothetical protein [Phaffia rhodozyma]